MNNQDNSENKKGAYRKYLTIERFEKFEARFDKFLTNDFFHLQEKVKLNSRLLWIILSSIIGLALIDRFMGVVAFIQNLMG